MTFLIETNQSTFHKVKSGEVTMMVHKFPRPVREGDKIIFQETDKDGKHTNEEQEFEITELETENLRNGYTAVVFKEKELHN